MDAPAPITPPPATPVDLSEPAPARRGVQMPAWLAVLVVLIVAGGFGYLGWTMLKPPPPKDLSQYDSNEGRGRWRNTGPPGQPIFRPAPTPPPPVEGVTIDQNGAGVANTPAFSVRFITLNGKPNLVPSATNNSVALSADDRSAIRARINALENADLRKSAGLTDDQNTKLRAINSKNPPLVEPAMRAKLLDLWGKYRAADAAGKPTAEKAVMDAVREAGAAYTAARTANSHSIAEQVRAVLNADQVGKLSTRR